MYGVSGLHNIIGAYFVVSACACLIYAMHVCFCGLLCVLYVVLCFLSKGV